MGEIRWRHVRLLPDWMAEPAALVAAELVVREWIEEHGQIEAFEERVNIRDGQVKAVDRFGAVGNDAPLTSAQLLQVAEWVQTQRER